MNRSLLAAALLALVTLSVGCSEGADDDTLCVDGECEDEEVATAEQNLFATIDFKQGCANKGWKWDDATQTCKRPPSAKDVCLANGNWWHPEQQRCYTMGSVAQKQAECARNGMVYVSDHLGSRCVMPTPSYSPIGNNQTDPGAGLELPCQVGLNCPTDPNPNTWDPYQNSHSWQPMTNCFDPAFCF